MEERSIKIANINDIKPVHKAVHASYEYYKYEVAEADEGRCEVSIYEIPPGKSNYPYHYHVKSEEVFYIISGEGILETPDGDRPIAAGDVVICPPSPKGAHKITNSSQSEMLRYLDCDTTHYLDVAFYPHSDKINVSVQGEENRIYRQQNTVGYYEGE